MPQMLCRLPRFNRKASLLPSLFLSATLAAVPAVAAADTGDAAQTIGACASVLDASDFTYKGAVTAYGRTLGQGTEGLTYRPSSNTWFTIARGGEYPYKLIEVSLPAPSVTPKPVTIVKDWGALDINHVLDVNGVMRGMKGLFWDATENKLWFTFGSYYANGANNNVLGYATLDTGTPVIHGPWKVSVHSDLAKGMLIEAPADMQAITHQRFLMFGIAGATMQEQSWGPGLVSVAEPGPSNAPGSVLASEKLVHWPMLIKTYPRGYGVFAYSNFPPVPGDISTNIRGNGDVSAIATGVAQGGTANTITLEPGADVRHKTVVNYARNWYVTNLTTHEQLAITNWNGTTDVATVQGQWTKGVPTKGTPYQLYLASGQPSILIPINMYFGEDSDTDHASWIELANKKCGLVYFGNVGQGYMWYGNEGAHTDPTPNGEKYNNDFTSLLHPGQPLHSDTPGVRGNHAEAHGVRWYILDPNAVLNVAQKAMAGTATAQNMQIPWSHAGDASTLGGNVIYGGRGKTTFGESYWDAKDNLLYVLVQNGGPGNTGQIQVWQIQ